MSWIFGFFGNSEQQKITSLEIPLYQFKDSRLILFAGGNKQTCFFNVNTSDSYWAVAGVGLKPFDSGYKVLDQSEWNTYLSGNKINLKSVNGHFVAIRYSD